MTSVGSQMERFLTYFWIVLVVFTLTAFLTATGEFTIHTQLFVIHIKLFSNYIIAGGRVNYVLLHF